MNELLLDAMRVGVKFHLEGDDLRISAPPGAMDDALRQKIRDHKADIVKVLREISHAAPQPTESPRLEHDELHRHAPFPLTDVQHAYWMGRKNVAELGNVSTHFYFELDCSSLDIERLNHALCLLIDRHEMLRAIVTDDGLQKILPSVPAFRIARHDASTDSAKNAAQRVQHIRECMSHEVRPADQWPLFDVQATAMPDQHVRLHLSLDMLILDAWSMFILFKEWFQLYASPQSALPALQLSYRDYVIAEQKLVGNPSHQRARDYWMARIDTLPPAPELPVIAKIADTRPRFSRRRERLDCARWSKLKEKARTEGLTVSGLLLSTYAEVLARWSHSPHFTLNLTLFNRLPLHPDVKQLVGDFTSLIMLEVDHRQSGTTFRQRAKQLQHQLMSDLEHRECSGVEVLREWSHRRRTGMKAVMPVVFTSALVLGGEDREDAGLVEQFGPMVYGVSQTPQVWLDNQVMEINGDLVFNWDAVDDVFAPGVLDAMFEANLDLLKHLADDDNTWLQVSVVNLPPTMQTCREITNSTASSCRECLLHTGFLEWAAKTPNAPAVITAGRTLSYRQLLAESMALAHTLQAKGVQTGELVAVLMHKGWEQIVAVMGTLIAGAAYMPIDAGLPHARQLQLLEIGEIRQVVAQPSVLTNHPEYRHQQQYVVHAVTPADVIDAEISAPQALQSLDDLAYVIFTSGTTGVPKGVMIDHRAAFNTVAHINRLFNVSSADRVLAVSSLSFDLSVYDIFGLLGAGGALVIPEYGTHLDAVAWKEALDAHQVTLWNSAPQLMRMLMDTFGADEINSAPLRNVLLSGDWIALELPPRIRRHYPEARVTSLGGATEASIWSNYYPVEAIHSKWTSIPYGKPLPNQTMWVLDHQMRPCPDHVRGHIYIGGTGLARGYWHDQEKTAARFITHPSTGERLYVTGDMGQYAPDGNIIFLGRDDNQVKIRGHRVELGEIAAVLRQHPEVEAAAVVATGTSKERKELAAYIQLKPNHTNELGATLGASKEALAVSKQPSQHLLNDALGTSTIRPLDASFRETWSLLDKLYFHALLTAFLHFGVPNLASERIVLDGIMARGVAPRYRRWMQRALDVLVEEGYAQKISHGTIEILQTLPTPNLAPVVAQVDEQLKKELDFTQEQAQWFTDMVNRLPDILNESLHSADIYTSDTTAQIYQKLFPDNHTILVDVVERIARIRGDGFKVLEIGAGLGSATQHLLPVFARHSCEYQFTDISEYFLERARKLFDSNVYPIKFSLFNLDILPQFQGYPSHEYDLIVASSMLHDAKNITYALGNLRSLLKPGGQLILLEETRFFRSFDLHMGLQQGFDGFEDEQLRPTHCLLSSDQWKKVLRDEGFIDAASTNMPGTVADYLGFHVIVASSPLETLSLHTNAITDYLSAQLPEYMIPRHIIQVDRFSLSANGKIDYKSLPHIPEQASLPKNNKIAPRNAVEQALLDTWQRIMPEREISVSDNFFDIGGDSLIATQLIREINQSLPFNLEMHELFQNLTIEALAQLYAMRQSDGFEVGMVRPGHATRDIDAIFPALKLDPRILQDDVDRIVQRLQWLPQNVPSVSAPGSILLTGATGWLGAYLLSQLLATTKQDIYCLVRANDETGGFERIRHNLARYQLTLDPTAQSRIKVVVGILERPRFGLSDEVWERLSVATDKIYHFGASVKLMADYQELFSQNVAPMGTIVELALRIRKKSIIFGSSTAIHVRYVDRKLQMHAQESLAAGPEGLLVGYAQSKWAAEQVLKAAIDKGINTKIVRISHGLPADRDMLYKSHYIFDSLLRVARAVPALPDWPSSGMYGAPIDKLVTLILDISREPSGTSGVMNIENPNPPTLPSVISMLHRKDGLGDCPTISLKEWLRLCFEALKNISDESMVLAYQLFEPTTAGSLVEVMFGRAEVCTAYIDQLPDGVCKLANLATDDYWRRFVNDI